MYKRQAYVPGDVIRSMSGRYIEVNNTDAEGRITLADAVTYAKQCCGVDRIVDIATLTDGIQTALGNRRCGAFTNNRALTAQVEKGAAAASIDCVLPFFTFGKMLPQQRVVGTVNKELREPG